MKICFVTTEFITEEAQFDGGLANYIYKIAKTLVSKNHEVIVLLKSNVDETFEYDGIQIIKIKVNVNSRLFKLAKVILRRSEDLDWVWTSYILNRKLNQLNKKYRFDIVQYSNFRATGLFRINKIPTVVRLSSFHESLNLLNDHQINNENKRKIFLEQESVRRADAVFGPGKVVADQMSEATGKKVQIIETLYENNFNSEMRIHNKFPQLRGRKYLLFVGKLSVIKGVGVISEIIYSLLDKHKDLHFAFAGIDAGLQGTLVEKSGLFSNRVHILGRVNKPQLYKVMFDSFAIVLPSIVDNFPNTAVEGLALGKIVLGTDGVGYEQIIKDGVNGFLCKPNDSLSLLWKLNYILRLDKDKINEIESAAKRSVARLSPDNIYMQTIDFYEKTIQNFNSKVR